MKLLLILISLCCSPQKEITIIKREETVTIDKTYLVEIKETECKKT